MNLRILIGTVLVSASLIAIYLGKEAVKAPLIRPEHTKSINFHTPAFPAATLLPSQIDETMRIRPQDGVMVLAGKTTITRNGLLILEPGSTIAANEYASLVVEGGLEGIGTEKDPISFISNELRQENRPWAGILFKKGSVGKIEYGILHHASPGISCEEGAHTSVTETAFSFGNLDVFGPCSYTP